MGVLKKENIIVGRTFQNKRDLFSAIADLAWDGDVISDKEDFVQGLFDREKEMSTGFEHGIAIPHTLNQCVRKASVFIVRSKNDILWDEKGKLANLIICLAIPTDQGSAHIRLLSSIARKLVDEEFTETVLSAKTVEDLYNCFSSISNES